MPSSSAATPPSGKKPWQGLQNRFSGLRGNNNNNNNDSRNNNNNDSRNNNNNNTITTNNNNTHNDTPRSSTSSLSSMSQPHGGKDTNSSPPLPAPAPPLPSDACMINAIHYRGFDILFVCTVTATQRPRVLVVAARTRAVLQQLSVPTDAGHIVAMDSHAVSGMVCLAFADGRIVTYFPKPAAAFPSSSSSSPDATDPNDTRPYSLSQEILTHDATKPLTVFGRYFWVTGVTAHCKPVFYAKDERLGQDIFARTQSLADRDPKRVHISLSVDFKLLVGHKDQLAVFDASPSDTPEETAILNWTFRLPTFIHMAKISGDGLAIAYVLHGDTHSNKHGVHTLIRERGLADMDHFMDLDTDAKTNRSNGPVLTALFYKHGPFLPHSAMVTRISFRGRGYLNTKVVQDDDEEGVTLHGNDLLLTTCSTDGSMRIFGQATWKQLYQWETPPGNSRADWIHGITFANVGELEPPSNNLQSPMTMTKSTEDKSTSSFTESLRDWKKKQQLGNLTSQAGAWIAELTFRGEEPALRLSRLSFVKAGGNDFTPAHVESIIATLPTGSIAHASVQRFLGGDEDSSFIVHGLWPAWDPWEGHSPTTLAQTNVIPPPPPPPTASPTSSASLYHAGVSHLPPTELRIYASDTIGHNVVIMECPLWGDKVSGEFELGSPLRYALKIQDLHSSSSSSSSSLLQSNSKESFHDPAMTSMEFKTGRLCTWVHKDRTSMDILWREPGTMNFLRDDTGSPSMDTETYVDVSATPLPICITTCYLPDQLHPDTIQSTRWWVDENFGESCRLLVLTTKGSLVVYEFPPIWSTLEPMTSSSSETVIEYNTNAGGNRLSLSDKPLDTEPIPKKAAEMENMYEIEIIPHPEYGLGIRLDVHREGQRIIVGSFKKHPLSGGMLPAEESGKIKVGDAVVKVNNISFEGKSMNETIEIMKSFGTKNPFTMVFRSLDGMDMNGNHPEQTNPLDRDLFGLSCASTLAIIDSGTSNNIPQDVSSFIILPRLFGQDVPTSQRSFLGTTLILFASRGTLTASWLYISNGKSSDLNSSNVTNGASLDLSIANPATKSVHIVDMKILEITPTAWNIAVCDDLGFVVIIMIQLIKPADSSVIFPSLDMKVMEIIDSEETNGNSVDTARQFFHLSTYSMDLFATMRPKNNVIKIWTANPAGTVVGRTMSLGVYSKYKCTVITHSEEILNIQFMPSGFLDSFPWLVVVTTTTLLLYRFNLKKSSWIIVLQLKYPGIKYSSHGDNQISGESRDPLNEYPHLLTSLKRLVCTSDEESLCRMDWHPDALIVYICANPSGPVDAIKRVLPQVYEWLSGLSPSISSNYLACAPHLKVSSTVPNHDDAERSTFIEGHDLNSFIDQILSLVDGKIQRGNLSPDSSMKQGSKDFVSVMAGGKNIFQSDKKKVLLDLLKYVSTDDAYLLGSIGKIMLKIGDLSKVDRQGQIFSFSIDLLRQVETDYHSKYGGSSSTNTVIIPSTSKQEPVTYAKSGTVASAACLAALLSDTQGQILKATKSSEDKMDWQSAKSMLLPFWLRSDKILRSIVEEIGLEVYRKTRDIMECAIFMISSGNMKKLKALAATDRSDSGRKFLSFISDNDFSTARGRAAAEKNAFSLLRKRRYIVSSAFFLLAQPPMLKNATEIILTQLDDPSLALMVTRLMGDNLNSSSVGDQNAWTVNNLRGMGGGGGFASGSIDYDCSSQTDHEEKFSDWKPTPNDSMRYVLSSRSLSSKEKDPCFQAIILLWLNRPIDASLCLLGRAYKSSKDFSDALVNCSSCFLFDEDESNTGSDREPLSVDRIMTRSNTLMGFVCRPFLLATMNAPHSIVTASALASSDALFRRGFEIPSLHILLDTPVQLSKVVASRANKDNKQVAKQHEGKVIFDSFTEQTLTISSSSKTKALTSDTSSSIFDTFSVPQTTARRPHIVERDGAATENSSIFDSYSIPTVKKPSAVGEPSSIFDSYEVPPPKKDNKSVRPPASTENSSIFDSFDVPRQSKKITSSPAPISSSIFDSYDVPTPKKDINKSVKSPVAPENSSIFDSFDVPKQTKRANHSSDPMSSSIFDSFDAKPNPVVLNTEKSGSVVSNFDPPKAIPGNQENETKSVVAKFNLEDEPIDSVISLTVDNLSITSIFQTKLLRICAARRWLREISCLVSPYQGDVVYDSMETFFRPIHPLIPIRVASMFSQELSQGSVLLQSIRKVLDDLSFLSGLDSSLIIDEALILIGCPSQPRKLVFSVLLLGLKGRNDLIEDILRECAHEQMRNCDMLTISNDDLTYHHKSKHYASSQYVRRYAIVASLQLEFCLWLHRSSIFPMSPSALKEVSIAVRFGILAASWGRCHEILECILRFDPDCKMDPIRGRQLWTSLKIMNTSTEEEKKTVLSSTGGWEFLVDCRRPEATELLRDRKAGSFLIRPHTGDQGVFTLSFKTNLQSTDLADNGDDRPKKRILGKLESSIVDSSTSEIPVRDDIVQHAIIRLSDAGFRCGHFGPFPSLQQLLEEISSSLPFNLLFSEPPSMAMVRNKCDQPSPNAELVRKLALHGTSEHLRWNSETRLVDSDDNKIDDNHLSQSDEDKADIQASHFCACDNLMISGLFSQLLTLAEIRKQLCAMAAADYYFSKNQYRSSINSENDSQSLSEASVRHDCCSPEQCEEDIDLQTSRIVRPLLNWCRSLETIIASELAPPTSDIWLSHSRSNRIAVTASDTEVETIPSETKQSMSRGDALIRMMIQPSSGVTFRTMRVGDGGQSVVVVLFSRKEATSWLISIGIDKDEEEAGKRLDILGRRRVIEVIDLNDNAIGNKTTSLSGNIDIPISVNQSNDTRYRIVDPWEVEVLDSDEGESKAAALGRGHYTPSTMDNVARASESVQRSLGGLHLVELWNAVKGGVSLTKAITSVYPPWERDAGGDSPIGFEALFSNFANSFSQHLYRNALFRRIGLSQRFMAVISAELLDLKNLTSPTGASQVVAFALARLKRSSSNSPLTLKARTIDSACTEPKKIGKASGPNAPCTWGSFMRFRFPLPEDVDCDGASFDEDRETLFKGIPSILQVSVYEKKFMTDSMLGSADVSLDGLPGDGQVIEWVPLRSSHQANVTWFIRVRLSLRFELMCLEANDPLISADHEGRCPSVAVRRLKALSSVGGAHEDAKGFRKILSAPDLPDHFD